ncbi:hypothetical protein B0H10DRAFT_1962093 [Mycena sp. CBHHK59/15]|nr:hypothetical protein B0H10DRAFT_1962093 [Mycena sp. CBHHK59/15]
MTVAKCRLAYTGLSGCSAGETPRTPFALTAGPAARSLPLAAEAHCMGLRLVFRSTIASVQLEGCRRVYFLGNVSELLRIRPMCRLFCAVSDFLKAGRRVAVSGFREPPDMMLSRMGLVEKSRGHFSLAETQSLGIAYHQGARACAVLGLFTVPVTGTAVVLTGVRRANPSVPSGGGEIFLRDGTGDGTVTDNGTVSALSHENLWPLFIRVTCGLGIAEKSGTTFRVRQTAFVRFGLEPRPVEKFPNSPTERVGCPSHGTRRTVATGTANSPTPFSSNMNVLPDVRAPLGALPLLCSTGCIQACGLLYTGDLELEASNECDVQWLTCTSQLACLCLLRCYGPRIRIQHVVVYPAKDHPTPET